MWTDDDDEKEGDVVGHTQRNLRAKEYVSRGLIARVGHVPATPSQRGLLIWLMADALMADGHPKIQVPEQQQQPLTPLSWTAWTIKV